MVGNLTLNQDNISSNLMPAAIERLCMIKELILFSSDRWNYYVSLIGQVYYKKYNAPSGSREPAYLERRRLISVAPSDYEGYIELVSERV